MKIKKILRNILFCLLSTCLFFGFAELLCRIKYHPKAFAYKGIFEYDKDKIYRLKKNIRNRKFLRKLVETNSFGYRDCEIPVKKDQFTIRLLAVGDSVTFGHGVLSEETYPQRLESLLNDRIKGYQFEVINTAVPGNSPFQEYYDLKRGLIFKPDIVVIQFALNDLVEPYNVFRRYGGKRIDYHGVSDVPYWHYLLSQKSAFYIFLQDLFLRVRFWEIDSDKIKNKAILNEINLSRDAAADEPNNPKIREAWSECLKWIQREFDLCRSSKIECILLVSPARFQLFDERRTYAQKVLKRFASQNGVECMDALALIKEKIRQELISKYKLKDSTSFNEIVSGYAKDVEVIWHYYFIDNDHYACEGHAFIADKLYPIVYSLLKNRKINI